LSAVVRQGLYGKKLDTALPEVETFELELEIGFAAKRK
jgi:hypothetical protein